MTVGAVEMAAKPVVDSPGDDSARSQEGAVVECGACETQKRRGDRMLARLPAWWRRDWDTLHWRGTLTTVRECR
jgi:hypothetical protein